MAGVSFVLSLWPKFYAIMRFWSYAMDMSTARAKRGVIENAATVGIDVPMDAYRFLGLHRPTNLSAFLILLANGFRWSTFETFIKSSGFDQRELAAFLDLPERTLARRRESQHLKPDESERLFRLAEIFVAAAKLFGGDKEATRRWLTSPVYGLNNARPVDFTKSDYGAREVRDLIGRLEEGVYS